MRKAFRVLRGDIVLCAAWLLAIGSAFLVPPSADYIDFRSLGLLWSLMVMMQVFREKDVFATIGERLLRHTHSVGQLTAVLVFLCFFFSMIITNDVALITFVPFAIMMLKRCNRRELLIPVIVLQTVAANLGSMMTPIGNPQNLYLYGLSGLSLFGFIRLVFPYTLISFILLLCCILLLRGRKTAVETAGEDSGITEKPVVIVYTALFALVLLVVLRVLPCWALAGAVLLASAVLRQKSILKADYGLLLTFVGFFVFTGNMRSIPDVADTLAAAVSGHEIAAGVLASQAISNVPAALLLSGFTENINALILGVNIGGLGTLIASMASLISYKLYAVEPQAEKGRYSL